MSAGDQKPVEEPEGGSEGGTDTGSGSEVTTEPTESTESTDTNEEGTTEA